MNNYQEKEEQNKIENKTFNDKLYFVFNILFYLVMTNLAMFFLSLIGVVVLTFMPALVALVVIVNSVYFKQEFPVFKTFVKIFLKEYIRSQKIFFALIIIGGIIGFDIYFFYLRINESFVYLVFLWVFIFIAILFILMLTHILHVYIYFPNFSVYETIKMSLLLSVTNLINSIIIIILTFGLFYVIIKIPFLSGLIPIIYFSAIEYAKAFLINNKILNITNDNRPLLVEDYY